MPKCIELLPCDWWICNLCYQSIEQVYLIKWPVSVCAVYCVYLLCIYKNTHMHVYICGKICYVYILYIFIYSITYMNINIHANTCKYFLNIYCMYVYLYIHNTYTQYKHSILCQQNLLFWMRLIAMNHLTALFLITFLKCFQFFSKPFHRPQLQP